MASQLQKNEHDQSKVQRRKGKLFHLGRWLIVFLIFLLIAISATLWIWSTQGTWSIIPSIVFTVLGVLLAFLQLLHAIFSAEKSHLSLASSLPQQLSPIQTPTASSTFIEPSQTYGFLSTSAGEQVDKYLEMNKLGLQDGCQVDWGEAP